MVRRALWLLAATAALVPVTTAHARPWQTGPLAIRAPDIVDARGRQVILHGFNVVYKKPPYYPNDSQGETTSFNWNDMVRLRSWGFNTIRLGVDWKGLEPTRGSFDEAYAAAIEHISDLAGQAHLYVLIDMHQDLYAEKFGGEGAPDWAVFDDGLPFVPGMPFPFAYAQPALGRAEQSFWEDRQGIRTEYVKSFARLATRFRGDRYVLGYDLYNEPLCDITNPACGYPPSAASVDRWLRPFTDQAITALRDADPTHPAFYEDWVTANFGYPEDMGRPPNKPWTYPNQGLSHHNYCGYPVFSTQSCDVEEPAAFSEAAAAAKRNQVAPLLTEFGATEDTAVIDRIANLADQFHEGWQYWQYKTYFDPTTAAATTGSGADDESVVDPSGRVKDKKLRFLARVYPTRVAGGDPSWSFDANASRFRMTYKAWGSRVIRLDGVRCVHSRRLGLPCRRVEHRDTVISVPVTVHYPHGYLVTVSGGSAISAPGARSLRIRAAQPGSDVRVEVAPAKG
jgi:endoglycosylceramidase